jgi:hypothetical protein
MSNVQKVLIGAAIGVGEPCDPAPDLALVVATNNAVS